MSLLSVSWRSSQILCCDMWCWKSVLLTYRHRKEAWQLVPLCID